MGRQKGAFVYSDDELKSELKRVAKLLRKNSVTAKEFDRHAKMNSSSCTRRFKTWNDFQKSAGLNPGYVKIYIRKDMPTRVINQIFKRDNYKCCLNGESPANDPTVELVIDHIIPVSKGGTNDPSNLWTLCKNCNHKKGTTYDINIALEAHKHRLICEMNKDQPKPLNPNHKLPNRSINLTPNRSNHTQD